MAKGKKTSSLQQPTERPNLLVNQIIRQTQARGKRNIEQWRRALSAAENAESPKRNLLYQIYDEILLDMHLTGEMEKRILAFTGTAGSLVDADGVPDKLATDMLTKSWFNEFLKQYMLSIFWGHRLLQVKDINPDGTIASIVQISQYNVIPERGMFVPRAGEEKGTLYREDPTLVPWMFEIGDPYNLGLLNKCVPHVLFRRGAQSAWAEFADMFAMPLRVGKTNSKDRASLNRMEDMMMEMATASFMILDSSEEVDFKETAKSDGTIFDGLIKLSENEISKGIFSSVIGGSGEGGSRAKEQVGLEIQKGIISLADLKNGQGYINETLIPKLIAMGYPYEGLSWQFEIPKDLLAILNIIKGMAVAGYRPTKEWVESQFNVPVEELPGGAAKPEPEEPKAKAKGSGDFFD